MDPVTVLVAGRPETRRACVAALADSPDVRVVGQARGPAEVLFRARYARPRVVVLASALGTTRHRILLTALAAAPGVDVLVVAPPRPRAVLDALAVGARGHVEPRRVRQWLAKAVRAVANGDAWCSRRLEGALAARIARESKARRDAPRDVAPWSNGRRPPRRRR